jgi:hypothetical protein
MIGSQIYQEKPQNCSQEDLGVQPGWRCRCPSAGLTAERTVCVRNSSIHQDQLHSPQCLCFLPTSETSMPIQALLTSHLNDPSKALTVTLPQTFLSYTSCSAKHPAWGSGRVSGSMLCFCLCKDPVCAVQIILSSSG